MSDSTQPPGEMDSFDGSSSSELLTLVYKELRQLAASKMAREAANHTLQPTALVHEAWLRLVAAPDAKFNNRAHFFAAAAEAMRRILIDRARHRQAVRNGGGLQRVDLQNVDIPVPSDEELLRVNEALERYAVKHPVEAQVVKLRHFVGMSIDETAEALEISPRSVKYYWNHARAWLFHDISSSR